MAVEQVNFTRGGIDYVLHIGIDLDGNSVDYIDRVQPDDNDNILRYYPAQTIIERDTVGKKGGVASISQTYFSGVIGGNGEIIEGSDKKVPFIIGSIDIQYFVAGLGMPIMRAGNNGLVRHPLGFNALPIFEDGGDVITYTEEEENEAPTFDYWTETNPS